MVTDPALCPIPPGFQVIGGFNDGFEPFKNFTGYDTCRKKIDDGEIEGYDWRNS